MQDSCRNGGSKIRHYHHKLWLLTVSSDDASCQSEHHAVLHNLKTIMLLSVKYLKFEGILWIPVIPHLSICEVGLK